MQYTFKTSDGTTSTRLAFVKQQLISTISEQLKDYQKFNIVSFGSSAYNWQTTNIAANAANIASAIKYLNGLG